MTFVERVVMMDFIKIVVLTIILTSCSGEQQAFLDIPNHLVELDNLSAYPLDADPSTKISFVRDQVFGDTEDVFLGHIGKFAVDDLGRVFISDWVEGSANAVYLFKDDGSFLTRAGRGGVGPGEFNSIRDINVLDDSLYIYDGRQWIHVFAQDSLRFSHTVVLNEESLRNISELRTAFAGQDFFVRSDGRFLMNYRQPIPVDGSEENRYLIYYLRDANGNILPDKIFEQKEIDFIDPGMEPAPGVPLPFTMPFTRSPLIAISKEGIIFSAWTEEFLIKIYDSDGGYERAIYYPFNNSGLFRQQAINMTGSEGFRRVLRNTELPETWPALHTMVVDDENRLWIAAITNDEEYYQWWVLEETGELLARFTWPGRRQNRIVEVMERPVIKNGYFYTSETDEETGVQQVVRYRIEMD